MMPSASPRRPNRLWSALLLMIVLLFASAAVTVIVLLGTVVLPVLFKLGELFWTLSAPGGSAG